MQLQRRWIIRRKGLTMDYIGIIFVWIAGYLFFSGIKISYIGERAMKFEVTDPTVLWSAVVAIAIGLCSIVFAIYKESRHTKEIQETTGKLQAAVGKGKFSLQENDCKTHEKLDRLEQTTEKAFSKLDQTTERAFSKLDSRAEQGFSKIEQYISTQQALQQQVQNNKMSTAELLAYVEEAVTRATETDRIRRERDELQNKNMELKQLTKQQEQSLQDLKKQVEHLSSLIEQKNQAISQLTQSHVRKSGEHDWDEER